MSATKIALIALCLSSVGGCASLATVPAPYYVGPDKMCNIAANFAVQASRSNDVLVSMVEDSRLAAARGDYFKAHLLLDGAQTGASLSYNPAIRASQLKTLYDTCEARWKSKVATERSDPDAQKQAARLKLVCDLQAKVAKTDPDKAQILADMAATLDPHGCAKQQP